MSASDQKAALERLFQRALHAMSQGEWDAAIQGFKKLLQSVPGHPLVMAGLGTSYLLMGDYAQSVRWYRKALKNNPNQPEVLTNMGTALRSQGLTHEALAAFRQALAIEPAFVQAHNNLGDLYRETGDYAQAAYHLEQARALDPSMPQAHINLGLLSHCQHDYEVAMACYEKAIALDPGAFIAHANRAEIQRNQGDLEAARASCDKALSINPGYATAYSNRGSIWQDLGEWSRALEDYAHALQCDPGHDTAWFNIGMVHQKQNRIGVAEQHYRKALAINPGNANAHFNLSQCLLRRFEWSEGWAHYEWRWRTSDSTQQRPDLTIPEWQGTPMPGHLLVLAEQGIGDQILYASLLPDVLGRVGQLTLTADDRLLPIYRRSFPGITVLPASCPLDPSRYQAYVSLASLGQYFRLSMDDFSPSTAPFLTADPATVSRIRSFYEELPRPWVGLSWRSINQKVGAAKTLDLQQVVSRAEEEGAGASFFDLQYGDTAPERQGLEHARGIRVMHYDPIDNFTDIDGLLALVACCDRVVTISNVTAHLAGSLGKPVTLLAPEGLMDRHWYWHARQGRSVWYPSVAVCDEVLG